MIRAEARVELARVGIFGEAMPKSIKSAQKAADDACEALQNEVNKEGEL